MPSWGSILVGVLFGVVLIGRLVPYRRRVRSREWRLRVLRARFDGRPVVRVTTSSWGLPAAEMTGIAHEHGYVLEDSPGPDEFVYRQASAGIPGPLPGQTLSGQAQPIPYPPPPSVLPPIPPHASRLRSRRTILLSLLLVGMGGIGLIVLFAPRDHWPAALSLVAGVALLAALGGGIGFAVTGHRWAREIEPADKAHRLFRLRYGEAAYQEALQRSGQQRWGQAPPPPPGMPSAPPVAPPPQPPSAAPQQPPPPSGGQPPSWR